MKKEFRITFKQFTLITLLLIFITVLTCFAFSISINYLKETTDVISSVVGAIGNIVGGVIGGIVAYIVAAYQISSRSDENNEKDNSYISSLLLLMKAEIQYNKNLMQQCKHDFQQGNKLVLLNTLSTSSWEKSSDKIAEKVPESTISKLIEYNIKTNAVKNTTNSSIQLSVSDDLIHTFDDTINLLNQCIFQLNPKKQNSTSK